MSVLFATKCWKNDVLAIVWGGAQKKVDAIGYPFSEKLCVFNNGVPLRVAEQSIPGFRGATVEVCLRASKKVLGIDFDLNYYASGEVVAVYMAVSKDYLCFVQGDCLTDGGDWVTPGIAVLESEPDVMVVSPLSEVNTWHDKDGYDHYMSDHAWLVRVKDIRNPEVYQVDGSDSDYPSYGGNSFEAMVGRYLKKTGKKRKILSEFWVHHPAY